MGIVIRHTQRLLSVIDAYFSTCSAILRDPHSDHMKSITSQFSQDRIELLEYENCLNIPEWVYKCIYPEQVARYIQLHAEGSLDAINKFIYFEKQKLIRSIRRGSVKVIRNGMAARINPEDADGGMQISIGTSKNEAFIASKDNVVIKSTQRTQVIDKMEIREGEERLGMKNEGSANIQMKKKVFIVHGHDDLLKNELFVFLSQEGYDPIILHHQVNRGPLGKRKISYAKPVFCTGCCLLSVTNGIFPVPA